MSNQIRNLSIAIKLFTILRNLSLITFVCLIAVASCSKPTYASSVHPHGGLALAGYNSIAHMPRLKAVFLCVPFGIRLSMVKLEGDAFARAGILSSQSANPFQLCHHYLAVIGKASNHSIGAHTHA
jgi:hypothetical protein